MRRGIWRRPGQPSLVDTFEPVQHGGNLKPVAHMYEQAPYIRRQGAQCLPTPALPALLIYFARRSSFGERDSPTASRIDLVG